jgi:hypothetical protein
MVNSSQFLFYQIEQNQIETSTQLPKQSTSAAPEPPQPSAAVSQVPVPAQETDLLKQKKSVRSSLEWFEKEFIDALRKAQNDQIKCLFARNKIKYYRYNRKKNTKRIKACSKAYSKKH